MLPLVSRPQAQLPVPSQLLLCPRRLPWLQFLLRNRRQPSRPSLLMSQLLTLFTTPVIYLQFDSLARRFGGPNRRKGESDPGLSEAEPDPGPAPA